MNAEHIQEKLTAVPAGPGARDQLSESGVKIDHEAPLYAAITNAFYHPVNDCAKHLGYPLVYCQARGIGCIGPSWCSASFCLAWV